MLPLADGLPSSAAVTSPRGGVRSAPPAGLTTEGLLDPPASSDGFAWFENRGIGRPDPVGLQRAVARLTGFVEAIPHSTAVLIGFSSGAAMAAALLLAAPRMWAGAALLSGGLPVGAGLERADGVLTGVEIFLASGTEDSVIPQEQRSRTEEWLTARSGASVQVRTYAQGHAVTEAELTDVSAWCHHVVG